MIKEMLSKTDTKNFEKFKLKYPGWDVQRFEDNSMKFIKPEPTMNVKQTRRIYIDRE